MNQKGFVSIVLVVVIVAVIAVGGYFVLSKKSAETTENTNLATTTPEAKNLESKITTKDEFTKITIDALVRNPSSFLNKKVQLTGKLILTGKNYFTDPRFSVTDGVNQFQVSTWLILEVPPQMPGSTGGQPPTMATYLDKTLTLQGTVEQNDQGFSIRVTTAF